MPKKPVTPGIHSTLDTTLHRAGKHYLFGPTQSKFRKIKTAKRKGKGKRRASHSRIRRRIR